MSNEQLKTLSDEDILAAAEQIIADEQAIQKSMENAAPVENAESDEEKKKKDLEKGCGDMSMDVKKSQADIEGKETGGLAPSVQGNLPDAGNGVKGGSESEANKGNHIENQKASEESGPASKETQSGDSEEEANKNKNKKHLMKDGDPAAEGGPATKETQTGSSQNEANKGQMFDLMKKSLDELTKAIKTLNARVAAVESSPKTETEEIRKSIQMDQYEILAKSYTKRIVALESENEKLQKSFGSQLEELKKSQESLSKENAEFKAKLSKPARTRETATAFDAIQKGNSEQTGTIFKSKHDVLEKLEELRKSGKISGDELISFNASGNLTENVKKQLAKG